MKSFNTKVTCRGTVIVEDSQGKQHEGYVGVTLAGKEVEILAMDGKWMASHKGNVRQVVPYTGQDGQQDLFKEAATPGKRQ